MQEKYDFFKEISVRRPASEVTNSGAHKRWLKSHPRQLSCCRLKSHLLCRDRLEAGSMKLPFLPILVTLTLTALFTVPCNAQSAVTPEQIKWGQPPPFVAAGAQLAVLEGNPSASTGDYTVRLKMPDGYKIAPHTHPTRENVTVISGTLKVGMGDTFDADKMMSFKAGSFAYLDPSVHHYAEASGATIIQIHGMSPLQVNYINPADDPS
jgi:quercetin dioxygenase-like cupin family protein